MMNKNKNDIMHVEEITNKRGGKVLRLYCSGKDPLTRKNKVYIKTYKIPESLKLKKEMEAFRMQCQIEWKAEVDKISKGLKVVENKDVKFCEYATECVERIIKYNKQAYSYYATAKGCLQVLLEKFKQYKMSELTRPVVQRFCDWVCERTYIKETYIVKQSLQPVIAGLGITYVSICSACNLNDSTLHLTFTVGNHVAKNTAIKVCQYLNICVEDYFKVIRVTRPYSYSANKNLINTLRLVLKEAVKDNLIQENYARAEYIRKITGTAQTKEIFDDLETIQHFNELIMQEPDLRKKAAFSLSLCLGLRGAEITGLSWSDFDFDKKIVHINKNTLYVTGFGVVTKDTKTINSNRIITMPDNLIPILLEYKQWWDVEKIKHGNLWADKDKLFLQNKGKDMSNATISQWLREFEEKHGFKRVTLHGLRHTNITLQIVNEQDIKTVSARAGHSDIQTTLNIYSHYTKEADQRSANMINKLLYKNI